MVSVKNLNIFTSSSFKLQKFVVDLLSCLLLLASICNVTLIDTCPWQTFQSFLCCLATKTWKAIWTKARSGEGIHRRSPRARSGSLAGLEPPTLTRRTTHLRCCLCSWRQERRCPYSSAFVGCDRASFPRFIIRSILQQQQQQRFEEDGVRRE